MIFYSVTDNDLDTRWFHDFETAQLAYESAIRDVEYPTGREEIVLERSTIPVSSDTVMRLLNGQGGYVVRSRILKKWRSEPA